MSSLTVSKTEYASCYGTLPLMKINLKHSMYINAASKWAINQIRKSLEIENIIWKEWHALHEETGYKAAIKDKRKDLIIGGGCV